MNFKSNINNVINDFRWQDLSSDIEFTAWKNDKIKTFAHVNATVPISVESLTNASSDSISKIKNGCRNVNFALFEIEDLPSSVEEAAKGMTVFAKNFGLRLRETHRSEGEEGVVALKTTSAKRQKGYIPYTPRALNWHTDGYYNDDNAKVHSFVLYCYEPALKGGKNQIIDPEIAYMRMRDENPDFVRAFMHPEAMTIPANEEDDGDGRPASVGPVFFADQVSGRLQMRYTARTRSIEWRDDAVTREAADWMHEWLGQGDEFMVQLRMKAGQGVLNNNVLHNRTSFVDDPTGGGHRTMMRARFHDRISEG